MRFLKWTIKACLLSVVATGAIVGCASDDDEPSGAGGGGTGGAAGEAGATAGGSGGGSGAEAGDAGAAGGGSEDPGALIEVTATGRVGVMLDEIPTEMRGRVAASLLEKPASYWIARAKQQLTLATYRLNFRSYYYDEEEEKMQLPLPPSEVLNITLVRPEGESEAAYRTEVEGHDYVLVDYRLSATLVTDVESPGISEKKLASVGGSWSEPFVFPVDPELLMQRTGYACMDEAEFPINSVDSESPEFFYDHECEVEDELSSDGCHGTELPDESCLDALSNHVGSVEMPLRFERVPWELEKANAARVGGVELENAADLAVVEDELAVNRLTYRYIEADSCALAEACVGGTGWRRLLQFNASEKNVGSEPVNIGDVNFYLDSDLHTPNSNHHVYVFSECHQHYHFDHFATFTYGDDPDLGSKRAFCLESVARYGNHERSPTWSPYNTCAFQGISAGWGDQYNAGIECQWVDVTSIDTSDGPVTKALGLESNPDGFLCEGTPVLDADGNPVWEPTEFETEAGETVDRAKCDFAKDWHENNYGQLDVTLPLPGEGMVTGPCTRGQIGPKRNCGFAYEGALRNCEPGESVKLSCSIDSDAAPQTIRVCEGSRALGAGVACVDKDALDSANLAADEPAELRFECPDRRDATETGGRFALYTAPVWPDDEQATVSCIVAD
jgi:hypothetical protein